MSTRYVKDDEGRVFIRTEAVRDLNWRLRYAPPKSLTQADLLVLASVCAEFTAVRHMTQRQLCQLCRVWAEAGVNAEDQEGT